MVEVSNDIASHKCCYSLAGLVTSATWSPSCLSPEIPFHVVDRIMPANLTVEKNIPVLVLMRSGVCIVTSFGQLENPKSRFKFTKNWEIDFGVPYSSKVG